MTDDLLEDVRPFSNPVCRRYLHCRDGDCWRALCPRCATYVAYHCRTADDARALAGEILALHECRSSGSPAGRYLDDEEVREYEAGLERFREAITRLESPVHRPPRQLP